MVITCKYCNKKYASYSSRSNHIKKYHKVDVVENVVDVVVEVENMLPNVVIKNNICKKCNKELSDRVSRWKHEKVCKKIIEPENKIEQLENKNIQMEREIAEYKLEMIRLKDLLQKSMKIHPKTLQKINNQLNNNGVINNTVNIVQLGNENLIDVLSKSEKRGILNRKAMGINDLVELIHCSGKYKEFMNVYITNLQNTVAYRYDKKINNFIAVNKNELLDEIIDSRIYDITKFYKEAEKVLDPTTAADIKRIIAKMETDDSFKGLKKEEIKFILYNNKDKIAIQKDTILDKEIEIDN